VCGQIDRIYKNFDDLNQLIQRVRTQIRRLEAKELDLQRGISEQQQQGLRDATSLRRGDATSLRRGDATGTQDWGMQRVPKTVSWWSKPATA